MPKMVETTFLRSRFQFFFLSEGQCPPGSPRERGLKASSPGTVTYYTTIHLLYLLQCLWKTLFKALTYASLEKYVKDTYSVVKLESPLNVRLLMWLMLLKVSTLRTGEKNKVSASHSTQNMYCERVMRYAEICPLKNHINIWNRFTFLNKYLIFVKVSKNL